MSNEEQIMIEWLKLNLREPAVTILTVGVVLLSASAFRALDAWARMDHPKLRRIECLFPLRGRYLLVFLSVTAAVAVATAAISAMRGIRFLFR